MGRSRSVIVSFAAISAALILIMPTLTADSLLRGASAATKPTPPKPSKPRAGRNSGNTASPTSTSGTTLLMGDLLTGTSTTTSTSTEGGGTFAPASLDDDAADRRYEAWGDVMP